MSKADVIEIEGTSEYHVPGRTGKWTQSTCTYQWQVKTELYPYPSRG